jgi:hypothetical protein
MEARKIQIKLLVRSPKELDVEPIVPVFHDWIRKDALGELLIDVTDYAHVPRGPSLLLVGHASDYCLDFAKGEAGLLYSRKRDAVEGAVENTKDAFRRVLLAAKKLEEEPSLETPLLFRTDELVFRVNDRLRAPRTKETLAQVEPTLRTVLGALYPGASITLEEEGDPRELFTLRVRTGVDARVGDLLSRVS